MRIKVTLAVAGALATAGTALVMSVPSANAIECPPGTHYQVITRVGERPVGTCVPWVHCDPVACTLPPVAPR